MADPSRIKAPLEIILLDEIAGRLADITEILESNDFHDAHNIDMTVLRVDEELIFSRDINVSTITVMPTPSSISFRINTKADEPIELEKGEDITITGHEILRIYISNPIGIGITRLHAFGRIRR